MLLINNVAESLTGWSQEEATGKPFGAVFRSFDPETRERRHNAVAKVAWNAGQPSAVRHSTVLVARDLSERPIEEISAPLRDAAGRTIGMVVAFRDITDALKMREERAKASKLDSLGLLAGRHRPRLQQHPDGRSWATCPWPAWRCRAGPAMRGARRGRNRPVCARGS